MHQKSHGGGSAMLIFRAPRFIFEDAPFRAGNCIRNGTVPASPPASRTLLDVTNTVANAARALLDLAAVHRL